MDGACCYLPRAEIREIVARAPVARSWWFRKEIRSALIKGTTLRCLENFRQNGIGEEEWGRIIEDSASLGVFHPSSFCSVFHGVFRTPWCPKAVNCSFSRWFRGGWQSVFAADVSGPVYQYDINSAYAWAGAALPMPDTRRPISTRKIVSGGQYLAEFTNLKRAPFPFLIGRQRALVSGRDIERYGFENVRVVRGWRFDGWIDISETLAAIMQKFRYWKDVYRAYWGRWAGKRGATEIIFKDGELSYKRTLPCLGSNFVWAHEVTSRVRDKIWSDAGREELYRVYVDSVCVPYRMKTGRNIGDWKLVGEYGQGLDFRGPGAYKDKRNGQWIKRGGLPASERMACQG